MSSVNNFVVHLKIFDFYQLATLYQDKNYDIYKNKYYKYKKKYINAKESNLNMTGGEKCQKSTLKKYKKRPSPPFPANDCQGQKNKGNDGKIYESVPDKNNVYKWVIVKDRKKEDNIKGTVDDFINLFQNIDFNLTINPKTLKKTKEYLEFINDYTDCYFNLFSHSITYTDTTRRQSLG